MTKTTPPIDIRPDHWDIVQGILQKHVPQYEVWAFGSRAKWSAKQYSDLDLAIITDKPLSLDISASLSDDFSESDLPYKVDIVDWATTSESFRKIIERDKVVVQKGNTRLGVANEIFHIPLRDLSLRITKGTTPTRGAGFVPFGINYVKSEAITARGSIDTTKFVYIDEATHNALARSQLRAGNVLFSMAGIYLGKSAVVQPEHVPANTNQAVGIITIDESKAYPRFIHYTIQSASCRAWVNNSAAQSAQPNFNLKEIGDLPIPNFKLEEQRAIAHILGTLDDKIELNRKQNETLEAMARALFKAWFVDFEPVRAKMEGRWQRGQSLPGLPAHLYDLFPDRLVDSELGEIPEGWDITSLSDYSSLNPESWTKRTRPGEIFYVDLSNTKWGRIENIASYEANTAPSRAQRVLRPFDTLVGTVRPGNGSFTFISDDGMTGSTGFAVLRPLQREYSEFVYLAATACENIKNLSNLADGGAYPAVSPEIISATQVPRANYNLLYEFSRQVSPMLAGMAGNERTSKHLAQLRDTLLPKLISGELRVPEVESFIKERGL